MAYQGEILSACGALDTDLTEVAVVAVSGSGPNVCGHLLLFVAAPRGMYFHVAAVNDYPRYMTELGYRRYMRENDKREIRRRHLVLPDPNAAKRELESLFAGTWLWAVLPHNCVAFVEDILAAGGSKWSSYSNCPAIAASDTVEERVNAFMRTLQNEIYRAYGVPR